MSRFASTLVAWQRRQGRRGLPWQGTRDPYRIWLSEVMLQQTQVGTVIPYYERFLKKYPTVDALARASEEEVLKLWSGLGYYARGRNLRKAASHIASHGFPKTLNGIEALPGVGRSTAAAIAAFAFGERAAILDGNVKRVLARRFGVEQEKELWLLAERLLPKRDIEAYTQGLMDLGATVCTASSPRCGECPLRNQCVAKKTQRIEELPAARPRRPLPRKKVTWLVLRHNAEVLLERRPAPGIWGGLWCFPALDGRSAPAFCRRAFACDIATPRALDPIEHGFTHFRLRITPLVCEVKRLTAGAQAPGRLWLDLADAAGAAVPAPVRTLLERLRAAAR